MTDPELERGLTEYARILLQEYAGLEDDQHGKGTPTRFLNMLEELTQCKPIVVDAPGDARPANEAHIADCIKWKDFDAEGDEMIVVRQIPFVSVCNHHVLPFMGYAHVGYIPTNRIVGLSKFSRVVKHFSRQLQLQERMTSDIGDFIDHKLQPLGIGVVVEAEHMCMTIRGVQSPGTLTVTSSMQGVFKDVPSARDEFLRMIGK